MKKEWIISKTDKNLSLIDNLLKNRGIIKKEDRYEFLNPLEITLTKPSAFSQMEKAVDRVRRAIEAKEAILIYGDFDSDGVTSTSLLIRTLKHLGANVSYFIPDRDKEGHGLNTKALIKLMATGNKPKLVITCDCASSDIEQVNFLNSFKIDVIITDHHEAPQTLPAALAIINPKAMDCLDENLSTQKILHLSSLAGVGVAFKLAQALLEEFNCMDFIFDIMPYVAVGTISDIVPLIGENRYFVTKGLQLISAGKHYGLMRLLESAGYSLEKGISAEQIAFGVAPRINASGRLDTVQDAVNILISDNKQEIEMAIVSLNGLNKVRQELCDMTFAEADEMWQNNKNKNKDNAIVLFNPKWHIGIIGIVASKLVEKYYKPTFLMTYSEETKQYRCSSRSIDGVNIYDVLSANAELFDGFGGHAMAGGLSFSKCEFNQVKNALNKTIDEILQDRKISPYINIDLELQPENVSENLVTQISCLEPFGASNPNPIFSMTGLQVVEKKLMGSNKNHLKLMVTDKKGNIFNCIWWSKGDIALQKGSELDIAFCPQLNTFNGNTTVQLILQDVHSEALYENKMLEDEPKMKFYDHRRKVDILPNVEDYIKNSKLKFAIFAEDKVIIDKLKNYPSINENIVNRNNLSQVDVLMFFDNPASQEIYEDVLNKVSPKFVHLMKYEPKNIDEKQIAKTMLGMIKFATNNKNGNFPLNRCASFLSQTKLAVETLIDIFEECKLVEIDTKNDDAYIIKYVCSDLAINISKTTRYHAWISELENIQSYKETFPAF